MGQSKAANLAADFGKRLELARLRKYSSASAFARALGIEVAETYRCYERGDSEPNLATLAAIALDLDVSLDHLILGDVPQPREAGRGKGLRLQ